MTDELLVRRLRRRLVTLRRLAVAQAGTALEADTLARAAEVAGQLDAAEAVIAAAQVADLEVARAVKVAGARLR